VEQINNKQWMAKKTMALNGSMNRMMESKIMFLEDDKWSLLRFVVVEFDFCYASDYTMAHDMFLLVIGSIRG
jgi:hypothetical protein